MSPAGKRNEMNPPSKEQVANVQSGFPSVSKDLKSFVVEEKQVKQEYLSRIRFFSHFLGCILKTKPASVCYWLVKILHC